MDMGRKLGECNFLEGAGSPSNTMLPGRAAKAYLRTNWHHDPSSRLATIDMAGIKLNVRIEEKKRKEKRTAWGKGAWASEKQTDRRRCVGEVWVVESRYGRAGDQPCWGNQKKMTTSQRASRMTYRSTQDANKAGDEKIKSDGA